MKIIFLDTEFYNTQEEYVTPVCCVAVECDGSVRKWWMADDSEADSFREYILQNKDAIFISYAFEAEARFIYSVFRDKSLVLSLNCLCLYVLYRQICNANDKLSTGWHYDGKDTFFIQKKGSKYKEFFSDDEEENAVSRRVPFSLVAATYKLLGVKRDQTHKDAMRDRILKGAPFTDEEKEKIIAYCEEDTVMLPELFREAMKHYKGTFKTICELSKYTLYSAIMVSTGYPVKVEWLKKLVEYAPKAIEDLAEETHKTLVDKYGFYFFERTKDGKLKERCKELKEYIARTYTSYMVSETGLPSISEDALKMLASPNYYTEPSCVIDYICRYKKLIKSLKSFRQGKGKKFLLDYLGSDNRIRPSMGIFVAQTSRSQPASNSFVHLKAAVFRFIVHPPEGRALFSIDYKSQEFLIAAANSNDSAMFSAYYSGDPYLYLAKNIGLCPPDATKTTHPKERNLAKQLELSLTYGMGVKRVAEKLGKTYDEAQALVNKRAMLYFNYTLYKKRLEQDYLTGKLIQTPDGWYLGPDNENLLSVGNFPGQGTGASIMRRAVKYCIDAGLTVIFTLHDALYFECELSKLDESICTAANLMRKACKDVIGCDIFVDIHAWGIQGISTSEERKAGEYKYIANYMLYEDKVPESEQKFWHDLLTSA